MDQPNPKVLIATPNFTNLFSSEVHTNHIECACEWKKQEIDFNWLIIGRTFVHFARTQACETALSGGYTHIFWLDDDAVIDPKILKKYIDHDKDIVLTPYPMRRQPHQIGVLSSTTGDFHDHVSYRNWTTEDLDKGLVECDGGGTHAMLIKTDIFNKTPSGEGLFNPYPKGLEELIDSLNDEQRKQIDHYVGNLPDEKFSLKEEHEQLSKPYFMMPKSGTEDMYFCYRAKKKGVKVWCDSDEFAGHVGFYPVVNRQHTEYYEKIEKEKKDGVPLLEVREGSDNGKIKANRMSGMREQTLYQGQTASIA